LFTYAKTYDRGRVIDFEQRSCVYNAVCYNAGFFPWTTLLWSRSVTLCLISSIIDTFLSN